jgi:hypothetical protein
MERKRETFFGKIHEKKQPKEGLTKAGVWMAQSM